MVLIDSVKSITLLGPVFDNKNMVSFKRDDSLFGNEIGNDIIASLIRLISRFLFCSYEIVPTLVKAV